MRSLVRGVVSFLLIGALIKAVNTGERSGRFVGVPYDFRPPTLERLKCRLWNPDEERIFTPNVFGVGWSINFYRLADQLGILEEIKARRGASEPHEE